MTASGPPYRHGAVPWLAGGLALSVALVAYLWITTTQWQRTAGEWEGEAQRYANRVAELDQQLDGANTELAAARDQLAAATGRISELANEKAQLGDQNIASQQYLDYQMRVSDAGAEVATALGRCVDGQEELIGYLKNADAYDPSDLKRFQGQVNDLCRKAGDANRSLQKELEQ